ncbi:MAG: hypothetical protein N3F63_01865 [Thermoplasmata archaeon]|nr:hypothetical protein [Thermoplasmata archaeon]
MESVTVQASARLHFGIIDMSERKRYGAIGVSVEKPRFKVVSRFAHNLEITGIPESAEYLDYVHLVARKVCGHFGINEKAHLDIQECYPLHVGLGGRTQCGLAVAHAILSLYEVKAEVEEVASLLGLGRYTGIGLNTFQHGGFIVDTGREHHPICLKFPDEWAFVVGIPDGKGLGETEETRFLEGLAAKEEVTAEICEKVLLEMVPALMEKDIDRFGRALTRVQELTGSVFAEAQGGVFSVHSLEAKKLIEGCGAAGSGQSSWGPAVYGLFPALEEAERAVNTLRKKDWKTRWFATKARNRGAAVE